MRGLAGTEVMFRSRAEEALRSDVDKDRAETNGKKYTREEITLKRPSVL